MAITTEDGVYAAMPSGQRLVYSKATLTSVAGGYISFWKASGSPAAASSPGTTSGSTCSSATTGALSFVNPTGGKLSYLLRTLVVPQQLGTIYLCDRLVQSDGLSGTVTSAQTVGTPTLPRYTTGALVEIWLEIYTATGVTQQTFTVSYTDGVNGAGRTATGTITASPSAGRMFKAALQAGDANVVSVQSVTLAGSTGTAGSFGVTLLVTLASLPSTVTAWVPSQQGPFVCGFPQVQDSACLAFYEYTTATTTGQVAGDLSVIQG